MELVKLQYISLKSKQLDIRQGFDFVIMMRTNMKRELILMKW